MTTTTTKQNPVRVETIPHFATWIRFARRGDWALYWVGNLAAERGPVMKGEPGYARARRADLLARAAWDAYRSGHVALVQAGTPAERVYLAVKRGLPMRRNAAKMGLVFPRPEATLCIGG